MAGDITNGHGFRMNRKPAHAESSNNLQSGCADPLEMLWNPFPGTSYPGILEMYFSICWICSITCLAVGFSAFALLNWSLAALNCRFWIMI